MKNCGFGVLGLCRHRFGAASPDFEKPMCGRAMAMRSHWRNRGSLYRAPYWTAPDGVWGFQRLLLNPGDFSEFALSGQGGFRGGAVAVSTGVVLRRRAAGNQVDLWRRSWVMTPCD